MPMTQVIEGDVQLSLLAASGHVGLAAEMLSSRFGLSMQYAENVLEQGYGLLIARLCNDEARQAVSLLSAMGLSVMVQPVEAMPPDEHCDVSIRMSDPWIAPKLIVALERLLGLTGLEPASFDGPEGLVVPSLSPARAEWLCAALRLLPHVQAVASDHQTARYDLFAEHELAEPVFGAVRDHLRLLGCAGTGFGDALASGLERRALERVLAQFPNTGLFGVNQAFQRYELLIIGKGSLSVAEFGDFLMTRPAARGIPARLLIRSLPLLVESWLTRRAAQQFLADYSAIGMHAITRLVRGWSLRPETP